MTISNAEHNNDIKCSHQNVLWGDWLVSGHPREGLTEKGVVGLHGGHHLLRHLLVITLCLPSSYV